jgi:predicted TPR repeat methyltransferase
LGVEEWFLEFHRTQKPQFLSRMRERRLLIGDNLEMIEFAAGNGFLTKEFIKLPFVDKIDLVELGNANSENLKDLKSSNSKIGHIYNTKIQNFIFEKKYDLIFDSQLFIYLTDFEILQLLFKVKKNLKPEGTFIFMEFVTLEKRFREVSVWTTIRQLDTYYMLVKLAGFKIMHQETLYYDEYNYGDVYFTLKLDSSSK